MVRVLWAAVSMSLVLLTGCQFRANSPLGPELTTKDFATLTTPAEIGTPPPVLRQSKAVQPQLPTAFQTKVSLNATEDVPLAALLEKVCAYLNIDLHIHKNLADIRLRLSITEKPFVQLLENICSLAKLRYRFENDLLFLEPDLPFSRCYSLQFLNLVRSSENKIASGTDIFSHSVGKTEGEGVANSCHVGDNGSSTSVNMSSANDFWKELEVNLQNLLQTGGNAEAVSQPPHFSLHKQAGMVSVWGTSEQHASVRAYLDLLRKAVSSQILIEAKVIEVELNEQFRSGVDWAFLQTEAASPHGFYGGHNLSSELSGGKDEAVLGEKISPGFVQYTARIFDGMGGIVKALQRFGSTRTLSSPRLTVMNNQSAVLKVARNHVYFKLNYSRHFSTKSNYSDLNIGSDIQTVPIGLVMSVQPAIDPTTRSVILFLRPTISRMTEEVPDPSVSIAAQQNTNNTASNGIADSKVPVIEVKEIDSVMRLKDNEVGVLGGLMQTVSKNDRYKNPLVGDIPIVKEAFSSLKKKDTLNELVILIRVKILDSPSLSAADERLVHFYTKDPRPLI